MVLAKAILTGGEGLNRVTSHVFFAVLHAWVRVRIEGDLSCLIFFLIPLISLPRPFLKQFDKLDNILNERYPDVMMSVQKLPPKKPFGSLDASLIGAPRVHARTHAHEQTSSQH